MRFTRRRLADDVAIVLLARPAERSDEPTISLLEDGPDTAEPLAG